MGHCDGQVVLACYAAALLRGVVGCHVNLGVSSLNVGYEVGALYSRVYIDCSV